MQRAPKQQLKVDFSKVVCLLCAQSILFNPFIFIFPLKKERNSQLNMSWIREGELTIIERFCANIIKVRMVTVPKPFFWFFRFFSFFSEKSVLDCRSQGS